MIIHARDLEKKEEGENSMNKKKRKLTDMTEKKYWDDVEYIIHEMKGKPSGQNILADVIRMAFNENEVISIVSEILRKEFKVVTGKRVRSTFIGLTYLKGLLVQRLGKIDMILLVEPYMKDGEQFPTELRKRVEFVISKLNDVETDSMKRQIETENMSGMSPDEQIFVRLCNILIPSDIMFIIFEYVEKNQENLNSISLLGVNFYVLFLKAWDKIRVGRMNMLKIPTIVMKSCRNVVIDNNIMIKSDIKYIMETINPRKLSLNNSADLVFENMSKSMVRCSTIHVTFLDNRMDDVNPVCFPNLRKLSVECSRDFKRYGGNRNMHQNIQGLIKKLRTIKLASSGPQYWKMIPNWIKYATNVNRINISLGENLELQEFDDIFVKLGDVKTLDTLKISTIRFDKKTLSGCCFIHVDKDRCLLYTRIVKCIPSLNHLMLTRRHMKNHIDFNEFLRVYKSEDSNFLSFINHLENLEMFTFEVLITIGNFLSHEDKEEEGKLRKLLMEIRSDTMEIFDRIKGSLLLSLMKFRLTGDRTGFKIANQQVLNRNCCKMYIKLEFSRRK